jgi:hypothetical protein
MDVVLLHAGDFGMDEIALFLFLDVDLDRRCVRLRAILDGTDKEAAEQVIKRIATDQAVHFSLLSCG